MSTQSNPDFDGQQVLAFAIDLAKKAGAAILQGSLNRKAKAEAGEKHASLALTFPSAHVLPRGLIRLGLSDKEEHG